MQQETEINEVTATQTLVTDCMNTSSSMVAYFCHHLSDNYVDLSDLYVDLSDIYVDLSDNYVDLSEKYLHN